jgi:aminopeptidase N
MKYKFLLLNITCGLFFFTSLAQNNPAVDVQHYQFKIELSDQSDTIKGEAIISIKFLQAAQHFSLDLQNISKGKGMQLFSATADVPLSVKHENDKILFSLKTPAKKNEIISFTINYGGIPANGLIISKNKYGDRTFFSDNWPDRAHHWIPCVDDVADKATVEFDVTAPLHYQVISNGLQVEETNLPGNKKLTRYLEKIALPTKVMVIGAADFAVNHSGTVNCIPVYSWVYPQDKKNGFYDYAMAGDILKWFINNVGPYAYEKLANVQSKTIFGGMENASAIFYSENSIDGKRTSESLLAHEIAHQWFGNMATEKSFAHVWLSEGFATYMTILYMKDKYGKDTAINMLNENRAQVIAFSKKSEKPVVDTVTKNYMELLNANSYEKGGWVLHMLNQQLGDSIFWKSIRKYYATYAGKNADTDDLQKIFEEVSGKNLQQFFKQWLYTSELPDLDLEWDYNEKNKRLTVTITQKQNYLFQLPLTLSLYFADGKSLDKTVSLTKQTETFTFSPGQKPVKMIIDPNTALLFIGNIR